MKKLARAWFGDEYAGQNLERVFDAFKGAFPSLYHLQWCAVEALLEADHLEDALIQAHLQLEHCSAGGEWPGSIEVTLVTSGAVERWVRQVTVKPYVGDRCLRVIDAGPSRGLDIEVDYSARPSLYAARNVIELVEELGAGVEWVEVSERAHA